MSFSTKLIGEIPVGNQLGEGIQWRAQDKTVWWTDILANQLYRYDYATGDLTDWTLPEPLASFAFTTDPNMIVAAMASGLAFYNLAAKTLDWIEKPALLPGESRFNDGRADRQGRFWSGTMMTNAEGYDASGRLFRLNTDLSISTHEYNINISNGLCWSPDSGTMYFADSLRGEMYSYDYDLITGECSNRRLFANGLNGASPDGATVDADGNIWSAQWGIGKVHVYRPDGSLIAAIDIPTTQPTCVAFGGEDMNLLFVSSATVDLSADQLDAEPSAGNVFIFETDARGLPEATFNGTLGKLGDKE